MSVQPISPGAVVARIWEIYRDQFRGARRDRAHSVRAFQFVIYLVLSPAVGIALAVVFWALSVVYQGMVVKLVQDVEDGRRDHSAGELLQSVEPVFWLLAQRPNSQLADRNLSRLSECVDDRAPAMLSGVSGSIVWRELADAWILARERRVDESGLDDCDLDPAIISSFGGSLSPASPVSIRARAGGRLLARRTPPPENTHRRAPLRFSRQHHSSGSGSRNCSPSCTSPV